MKVAGGWRGADLSAASSAFRNGFTTEVGGGLVPPPPSAGLLAVGVTALLESDRGTGTGTGGLPERFALITCTSMSDAAPERDDVQSLSAPYTGDMPVPVSDGANSERGVVERSLGGRTGAARVRGAGGGGGVGGGMGDRERGSTTSGGGGGGSASTAGLAIC